MTWDDITGFFAGTNSPWTVFFVFFGLVSVLKLLGHSPDGIGGSRSMASLAFAAVAVVVARHFGFTVTDQNILLVAVYSGMFNALPQSK